MNKKIIKYIIVLCLTILFLSSCDYKENNSSYKNVDNTKITNDKLPQERIKPVLTNINEILEDQLFVDIPDLDGKKVNQPLFYFSNIKKTEIDVYEDKVEKAGFQKVFGYKWDAEKGYQYGFIKNCTKLYIQGYNQEKDIYGMEIRVSKNKTDDYLEEGELKIDEATKQIFNFLKKDYVKEKYRVNHVYMNGLWSKMKAQVVCIQEKPAIDDFNGFYIDGTMYLLQKGKVCILGSPSKQFSSVNYSIVDYDNDGQYELMQVRMIGSGMPHSITQIFKDGRKVLEKTDGSLNRENIIQK